MTSKPVVHACLTANVGVGAGFWHNADVEDPRIYFAAERTLLAWVRTGIAIMAFGFVVARFGLFMQWLPAEGGAVAPLQLSSYLGSALVVLGAVAIAAGAMEYRRYYRTLPPADLPSPRASRLPLMLAWLLVGLGIMLVVSLLI